MTSVISVLDMDHTFYLGHLGVRMVNINHTSLQK